MKPKVYSYKKINKIFNKPLTRLVNKKEKRGSEEGTCCMCTGCHMEVMNHGIL